MSTILREAINKVLSISRVRYPKQFSKLWVAAAALSVISYPEKTFTMEEVREWVTVLGLPELPCNKSWGAITRALKAEGHILETGETRRVRHVGRSSVAVKIWKHIL